MEEIRSVLNTFISLVIAFSIFTSCKKDEVKALPTISTSSLSSITASGTSAGGNITRDGGAAQKSDDPKKIAKAPSVISLWF